MSEPPPSGSRAVTRFFGWLLISVGGLIGGLCGVCTLLFIGVGVANSFSGSDGSADIILALVVGVVPTAIGAAIVFAGLVVLRSGRPPNA